MKILLVILISILSFTGVSEKGGAVSVSVEGLDLKEGGDLIVKLFVKDGFPYSGKEVAMKKKIITDTKETIVFSDLNPGIYAAAVYQDINSDGKLNSNFIGIPNEPAAFSKNKMGMMGPPDFEDVCFTVEAEKRISLTVYL